MNRSATDATAHGEVRPNIKKSIATVFSRCTKAFEDLTLSNKLTTAFLLVAVIPVVVVITIAQTYSSQAIQNQAYNQLEAVREIKKESVERYFKQIRDQILVMSSDTTIVNAMSDLPSRFASYELDLENSKPTFFHNELAYYYQNQFGKEYQRQNTGIAIDSASLLEQLDSNSIALQYQYIQANAHPLGSKHLLDSAQDKTSYSALHKSIHPQIRSFLEKFGYYDIFLVDIDTGNIVYSVFKELDFSTSLLTGPYANTNLATAFHRAKNLNTPDEFVMVDYQSYLPSYDGPASFIASPIFNNDKKVGVLIFQMPIDVLNKIMSNRAGLGDTGETYLVGEDLKMRSDSYLDPEYHSVAASFRAPETGQVDTEAMSLVLQGKSGEKIILDYNGSKVLSAYTPINVLGLNWGLIAEIDKSEAFEDVYRMAMIMLVTLILAIVLIIFSARRFSQSLISPIRSLEKTMNQVEREGNFSLRCENTGSDEIGQVSRAFNQMLGEIQASIGATNNVMNTMAAGGFSARIEVEAKGDLATLKDSTNACASALDGAITEINEVILAMSQGDFKERIKVEYHGDLATMKKNVNHTVSSLEGSIGAISSMMNALSRGDFGQRIAEHSSENDVSIYQGELAALKDSANHSADALEQAMSDVNYVVKEMSQGNFKARITSNLTGELDLLKQNVNLSVSSLETAIGEISSVMNAFSSGDFSRRVNEIDTDKESSIYQGELESLKFAANSSADALEQALGDVNNVVKKMSQGDFKARITSNLSGELAQLKQNVNLAVSSLEIAIGDISSVMNAFSLGDFSQRVRESDSSGKDSIYQGELKVLKVSANNSADALEQALFDVNSVVREMSQGNFKARITSQLTGDLLYLKENVNHSVSSLDKSIGDIVLVMESFRDGNFSQRVENVLDDKKNSIYQGDLARLKSASNDSADALEQALRDVNAVVYKMSQGDFKTRITSVLKGELLQLKTNINTSVSALDLTIEDIAEVVLAISVGDFSKTVKCDAKGQLGELKNGINHSVSDLNAAIKEISQVMMGIRKGDFKKRVETQLQGQLGILKTDINQSLDNLNTVVTDITQVMVAFEDGNFSHRVGVGSSSDNLDTNIYQGDFGTLKQVTNASAESLEMAFSEVGSVLNEMSRGNFKERVTLELKGELAGLKNNINNSVASLDLAINEIANVMEATRRGELSLRISSDFKGQLGVMKDDINASLDTTDAALKDVMRVMKALAKGDLSQNISADYLGVYSVLQRDVNLSISKLSEIIRGVHQAAINVASGAQQIAQSNLEMSSRTEEQSDRLEETSRSMTLIMSATQETESMAKDALVDSNNAKELAVEGGEVSQQTSTTINQVNEASKEINAIIEVIDGLTFQTNLLALNAAVEAARAGEQGRGFAVVASEVRELAGRSGNAAKEIRSIISRTTDNVDEGSKLATAAGKKLEQIVSSVSKMNSTNITINKAAAGQSDLIKDVEQQVSHLSEMTMTNAGMVEETASAAKSMAEQAGFMNELINFFNVSEAHP